MVPFSQSPESRFPSSSPDGLPTMGQGSDKITPSKRIDTSSTIQTITPCHCRCGMCSCGSCMFRANLCVMDQNPEAYTGQGTMIVDADEHPNSLLDLGALSLEAPEPRFEMISKLHERSADELAERRTEEYLDDIEDAPWNYFMENSLTSDATETSGMFFGPMDNEDSMENHPLTGGTRSMLSSFMSAISARSDNTSAIVKHAGGALGNPRLSSNDSRNSFIPLL